MVGSLLARYDLTVSDFALVELVFEDDLCLTCETVPNDYLFMAVRALQLSIVFTIGFYLASATLHAVASEELQKITLSLHLEDPKDVIVARGQSASLRCGIQASTVSTLLRWQYNNVPIPLNDSRWQILDDGTLYIAKVAGKRVNSVEGDYQCLVKNEYGGLLSNPAKLKIASLGRDFVEQPEDVSAPEGQPVVLPCNIHSFPSAVVTWERNYLPLPHTTRYVPLPSGALLITSTHSSDVGSYRCTIVNQILKKTKHSQAGQLTVLATPTVVIPPKFLPLGVGPNVTALVGQNLTLYCVVSGWPIPVIQWLKNASVVGNSSLLELQNVTAESTGDYVCSTRNSGGRMSQTFHVEVQQAPYFSVTPVSRLYPSSMTLRLLCEANGIPEPKVYWLVNGTLLKLDGRRKPPQSGHGLVISHSFSTDTGLYQCVAENSVGRKWVAAQLVPIFSPSRPSPPENVRCRSYNDTSICLQWSPPPNINIKAYSVYAYHTVMGPEFLTNTTNLLAANLNSSTNYTFYVRLYSDDASDQSQTVTCETGTNGKRNLQVQIRSESSVELTWSEVSSDVSCEGIPSSYRVQWRSANQTFINVEQVNERKYIITDLLPATYEFRAISSAHKNENGKWIMYVLPAQPHNSTNRNIEGIPGYNETEPTAPYHLRAEAVSSDSINLIWSSNNTYNIFFSICYVEVASDRVCESGEHRKSVTKQVKITDLKPGTSYEFKVRGHSNDGNYGPYSHGLEIRTLPEGPANIQDIKYRVVNSTTVCLKWRAPPYYKNAKYVRYIISYRPNRKPPIEQWQRLNITASQKYKACWLGSPDTLSALLHHLDPDVSYTVIVRSEDDAFVNPASPITLSTKPIREVSEFNNEVEDIYYKQKLGFILGISLSLLCIMSCVSCLIFRRRCLKRRALAGARLASTTNYYNPGTVSPPCTSLQLRHQESCTAEAQEMQNLIGENGSTHIPAVTPTYLDTKGGANFPNSQVNGMPKFQNGFVPNGHVHITENPRFYLPECNGHINSKHTPPENHPILQPTVDDSYEEDSNSNLQNSKLRILLLHESSGNKPQDSSLDSSLNATQLTCFDDSISVLPTSYRKISAPLGPNG